MEKIEALASTCRIATPHDSVLNSECVFTFHSPYTTDKGIVVNLNSFVGTVDELAFSGSKTANEEGLFVRIVKKRVLKKDAEVSGDEFKLKGEEVSKKVTKLGVGIDGGFQSEDDAFQTISTFAIVRLKNQHGIVVEFPYRDDTKASFPSQVVMSADSIIHHAGLAVQQDLTAWELDDEPKPVSKYCENLPFVDNGVTISPNPADWRCEKSGSNEHVWLNLSDGYMGGGRKNWDGSGGTNGALDHFLETEEKYPLVVKLGTITEDIDTADCYSYARDEDGPVKIPNLTELLSRRGINVSAMRKTVKSTAELEVELNATYAFDAITEAGASLIPVSGPGLQGLQNLGNSCYINSVVQMFFGGTVPELASRYGIAANGDVKTHKLLNVSPRDALSDILCQTAKLSCALTSGSFAGPVPDSATVTDATSPSNDPKYRLAPRMFKYVVGNDHVDFRTGHQQDAAQFLQYLLEKLDRAELGEGSRILTTTDSSARVSTSSNIFAFKTEVRLRCAADGLIKYKVNAPETILSLRVPMEATQLSAGKMSSYEPDEKRLKSESEVENAGKIPTISFNTCLHAWAAAHVVDDYRWPHLQDSVSPATEQTRFFNFPRFLIVQFQRYELGRDWVPTKLEVNIDMPEETNLNDLKSSGPRDGETLVPENLERHQELPAQPDIDEGAVAQLMDMGFNSNICKRALRTVGGSDVEEAMSWIFEHNNDPEVNDPLPEVGNEVTATALSEVTSIDEGLVTSMVENLGCFTVNQVRAALKECDGSADRAADWLFSHMDNIDAAIAALAINNTDGLPSVPAASETVVEDGDGKYTLVGLVSHIGKDTSSGHYVAHLKKRGKWVIFNDEKVALSESPPIPHAYMYLFQRNDSFGSPHPNY